MIEKVLTDQLLTGIWLEDACLFIRFSNHEIACIELTTRIIMTGAVRPDGGDKVPWLTFPGWLKILRVMQDPHQVVLEVGALYTARICIRHSKDRWQIVFQGGRALAD